MTDSVEKVGVSNSAQFFQRRECGFQMQTWGTSSSPSNSTEQVLNRFAAAYSVNLRRRSYFGGFATTLDLGLFQQNRPLADIARDLLLSAFGVIADMSRRPRNVARCDAAWAACSYPDHLLDCSSALARALIRRPAAAPSARWSCGRPRSDSTHASPSRNSACPL